MTLVKVIVELHEGETTTTKLWRFNSTELDSYTLQGVRNDVLSLFPHLAKKGMTVELSHVRQGETRENIAMLITSYHFAQVNIDSDKALLEALSEYLAGKRKEYLTLYAVLNRQLPKKLHPKLERR